MSDLLPGYDRPADDSGRAIVRRTDVAGVQSGATLTGAEERGLDEQGEHGLREEEDDDQVENRGQTEREREALHASQRKDEQHNRAEQRHGVGHDDGPPRLQPAGFHGRLDTSTVAHLVPYS